MYSLTLRDPDFADLIAAQAKERGQIGEHYYWISVAASIRESLKREAERQADARAERRSVDEMTAIREATVSEGAPCS